MEWTMKRAKKQTKMKVFRGSSEILPSSKLFEQHLKTDRRHTLDELLVFQVVTLNLDCHYNTFDATVPNFVNKRQDLDPSQLGHHFGHGLYPRPKIQPHEREVETVR